MKKIALILIFVASCGIAFSDVYFQFGCGLAYLSYPDAETQPLTIRGGAACALLYPFKGFELGVEVGVYALPMDFGIAQLFLLDIPIEILARFTLGPDRRFAVELFSGIWIREYSAAAFYQESFTLSDSSVHAGGRLLLDWFYIGSGFIAGSQFFYSTVLFEIGAKMSVSIPTR
jgi:hypothetical protein